MDRPEGVSIEPVREDNITIGEFFAAFDGEPAETSESWPGFRGANHDNISSSAAKIATSWPADGPPLLWSVDRGEGHAAPAIWKGRVFLLDYDETEKADVLRCFSLQDGREIWRRWYHVKLKRNHGLSRTVPAVTDSAVVTIGPRGHVMAVHPETGDFLWGIDLEQDWGTTAPFWYTGQCPVIDNGLVVLAPAGSALMLAVDVVTGEIVWQTDNPDDWKMSHTSVVKMTLDGVKTYVYSALGGIVAVVAEGDQRGSVLWKTKLWDQAVLAPSPLVLPNNRLFLTAGYGAGSMILKIDGTAGQYEAQEIAKYGPEACMASEQQTPILWNDHVFAIMPKDGGEYREEMVCYDKDDWQKLKWSSGKKERFGLGPYLMVNEFMFILDDDGVLSLIERSTSGYRRLAQADVLEGHDAWGPMAFADGRLLVRDSRRLACLDVSEGGLL